MYAIEFETVANEPYIKIPEFERFKGHKLKVILLDTQDDKSKKRDDLDFFDKFELDLSNFKFNRDEANER